MGNVTVFKESLERHKLLLEKHKPEFSKVLPPHLTPDRVARNVINALAGNEYLCVNATGQSVVQAAMTAAVLGLDIDNVLGQAYIVPFKGKAQLIPGYKGYISLAANAGYLLTGDVVRERDEFKYWRGLDPNLIHIPYMGGPEERGPIKYVYATARSKTLPSEFQVLHIDEVNKSRDRSEGYKSFIAGKIKDTPWVTSFEAMAKKTAIRALGPELPLNVQKAVAIEGAYESGKFARLDEHGSVIIDVDTVDQNPGSGSSQEQPNLVANLGLEPGNQD